MLPLPDLRFAETSLARTMLRPHSTPEKRLSSPSPPFNGSYSPSSHGVLPLWQHSNTPALVSPLASAVTDEIEALARQWTHSLHSHDRTSGPMQPLAFQIDAYSRGSSWPASHNSMDESPESAEQKLGCWESPACMRPSSHQERAAASSLEHTASNTMTRDYVGRCAEQEPLTMRPVPDCLRDNRPLQPLPVFAWLAPEGIQAGNESF